MPFAGYKDFKDCERKNQNKKDPAAFCAWLEDKVSAADPVVLRMKPSVLYGLYRLELMAESLLGMELLTKENAEKALKGDKIWRNAPDAVVIDDHRWIHVWANGLKGGAKVFLNKTELRRLHNMIVDELARRRLDSGLHHKSPLPFGALELGGDGASLFLANRKEFLLDPAFISLIGSSLAGKEEPDDLDVLIRASKHSGFDEIIQGMLSKVKGADIIWDSSGPNGPYIPAYELWARPVENSVPMEPKYLIQPMSPIPPANPTHELTKASVYSLFEDSYYVEPVAGMRLMIHRKENNLMAFDKDLEESDIPGEVADELLALEDPKTFILDGFLNREDGQPIYRLIDMPWWRESEHINQTAELRRHFIKKLPEMEYVKLNNSKYFSNRVDAVNYLKEEDGPFLLIPGMSTYPLNGVADWLIYSNPDQQLSLAQSADDEIRKLVDSGEWESKSADERFGLMTKRKKVEPLYPFAQLKTTKKGYSAREVFGLKSVEDLAKELFNVPNKQSTEVKVDGFRTQVHKKGDRVKIFTESGHEITEQLPSIIADAKSLPAESFALDSECTPYSEDFTNEGRAAAAPAFAKGAKGPVDDKMWALHVFDILYLDGEDLHNLPYQERRQRLRGIELPVREVPKKKTDFRLRLWENTVHWATSAEEMIRLAKEVSDIPGSEGAMFKQADSKYRLSGNTPLWSKMKQSYEVDALIVGINKKGNTYNYVGAVGPVTGIKEEDADAAPVNSPKAKNFVNYKGKIYAILGKTFNTNEKAEIGNIIRVTVKDIRKIDNKAYHWFHPKVLEIREDKTKPDPVKTAETISEAAKSQQRKRMAFISSARYEGESPIRSCEAPWVIVEGDGGGWMYLENNEKLIEKLHEFDVDRIYTSAMDRNTANNLLEAGIDFEITAAPTIADFVGRRTYLESDWPPSQVRIDPGAFSEFYSAVRAHPDFHMKLSCGAKISIPKTNIKKLADAYMNYPDEKGTWKYVIQFHIRGLSVHADFRAEINKNQLIGWTWDLGKSLIKPMLRRVSDHMLEEVGLTKAQLKDMEIKKVSSKLRSTKEGRALMKQLSNKTQDLSYGQLQTLSNELWEEEVKPILESPNKKILTQRKAVQPHAWLTYKGEVPAGAVGATSELEGIFIIMDKGTIEYGAQKTWFHEYFLEGKIKRKMVVRKLPTREDWELKQSFAWLTFFTKPGEMPYTISKRAVKLKWMPPKGISAIPKSVRNQIPGSFQYWRAKNAREEIRDELVKQISKKDVTLKLAAGLQFAVKRVWHKGPEVRRGVPVVRYWLLLHDGGKVIDAWDFGTDVDPTEDLNILARRKDAKGFEPLLKTTGTIPADHPASYTKRLPNNFDTSDQGKATIVSDENNLLRLRFSGGHLKGLYVFVKRDAGGDSWIFQKAELAEPKKAMLLQAAVCETGYCTNTKILKLGAKDFKYQKVGNLLFLDGPAIKPGEVIPMDGKPSYFTKEGIKRIWPSMYRQPIVVLHGDLKGDVIGFVDKIHYDEVTGWGWIDRGVIWHPLGMKLILEGKLPAFSIEVIPESIWDPEHQHDRVIGGKSVGLAVVPKGACVTCNYNEPTMGELSAKLGQVYKFGMLFENYLQEQYWVRGLSTQEIANREGIPRSTIEHYMKLATIPRRSYKEARRLRSVREATVRKFGGRVVLTALGTGAYTDIPRDDCPQCAEAREGGKSVRNLTASLFSVGADHLLINAPPGISGMLGTRKLKPNYVLIEHIHEDAIGGLHELRPLKPAVFATAAVWAWLRKHYRGVSKEKGDFDDIYGFARYVIKPGQGFALGGAYTVAPYKVDHAKKGDPAALGFKIDLGGKKIWHSSDVLSIPDHKKTLGDVDIYIGDGSSLTRDISGGDHDYGHASMEKQIKWAQDADIEKIYFTQIGHVKITHEELQKKLKEVAVNAEPLFDSMEIGIGGASAGAYYSAKTAQEVLNGERKIIVRAKPYSEYARQVILLLDENTVHGMYIEGFPEGPLPARDVKEMEDEHMMAPAEWKKEIGDTEKVWIYHPRILKRFDPPRKYNPVAHRRGFTPAGPYIHDVKMLD